MEQSLSSCFLCYSPNLIIILADDMRRSGLGCYDNQSFGTTEVYRLAREGLRLTDFHIERVRRIMKQSQEIFAQAINDSSYD